MRAQSSSSPGTQQQPPPVADSPDCICSVHTEVHVRKALERAKD